MAAEYRTQREQAKARQEAEQARQAKRPDVLGNLPALLQEEYGLSQEEAALAIRNGIFNLFPDDAPLEHRQQLWEAKQAREKRMEQQAHEQRAIEQYRYQCGLAARSATDDHFPDSVAFYDGDHARYARALEKKALDMASKAQQQGILVDVTLPAVQRALEQDLADRLNRAEQKRTGRKKPEPTPDATQVSQSVASARTASAAVTPAPRAGKKTVAEADAEVMALLSREFSR